MFDRSEALSDLRHKLEANVPTFGAWQQLNSPAITELLCGSKSFDWIVFDLEHGLIDFSSLYVHILAAELHGKLPFVRLCNPLLQKLTELLKLVAQVLFILILSRQFNYVLS